MKTIHKSYKYRIYPNEAQKVLLAKHFGSCRFVYNHFLNVKIEAYKANKQSFTYFDATKQLTHLKKQSEYAWLKEIGVTSLRIALKNLDSAYQAFFRKQNQFPKFKNKHAKQSFKVLQNIKIKDTKLIIPKFREGIKINLSREPEGRVLFATISKTINNKYCVSITCETTHKPLPKAGAKIGIDTGVKDLATLSTGQTYENPKILKTHLKKLKYEQRQLSKKKKGSNARFRQRQKVARLHQRIADIRQDYLHKSTSDIIKNHDTICIEDLAVKNMIKNHRLAQALSDVSLGEFYQMLEYKASWNDRTIVKVGRFFPSSKMCSSCGSIKEDLTLKVRQWTCKDCGTHHDRDVNASKNILNEGLKILCGCGLQSHVKQKQVEALPLGKSMKPEFETEISF